VLRRLAIGVGIVAAITAAGLAFVPRQHLAGERPSDGEARILFVCQNGVAMSIWSALTFERLAAERGLSIRAISRASAATFTEVPLRMRFALALEGYGVGGYRPQVVDASDVQSAARVILIDTELPASASYPDAAVERWDGFPPMRERYFESRAALRTRVEALVTRLASSAEESDIP
jgi:protein-tyrosine-phosphatase